MCRLLFMEKKYQFNIMFQLILFVVLFEAVNLTDLTYYEVLGLSKQASTQEIRQAYKKLAVKYHPDKNPDITEQEKFIKITEAYETLKDSEKRRKYDIYGSHRSYTRKYDYHTQSEYNNLFYNGLYNNDPYVDTLSEDSFYNYLQEGIYFINFYSPFCPPCQNLADHWKQLAEKYEGIIKVGAVNCKYYNSFCYRSMKISHYPTLLFYAKGKKGHYRQYNGEHSFEALDQFVMGYINSRVQVPTVKTRIENILQPVAYILGTNTIDKDTLTRLSFNLLGLVTFMVVENENIRNNLTKNEYTTIVYKYKDVTKEIEATEEKEILKAILEALPKIQQIGPGDIKRIRDQLRNGYKTPWVFYFSTKGQDRLLLHQMLLAYPDIHFGEIDCDRSSELCVSLQVETPPAWSVLKVGGAYQLAQSSADIRSFIASATSATELHSLSASDLLRILDGDVGSWVLLIVPYQLSWDHLMEPFTRASLHYASSKDISFGIMVCTQNTDKYCRQLATNEPVVVVQYNGRHMYHGRVTEKQLIEFIDMLREPDVLEIDHNGFQDIVQNRHRTWFVAIFPEQCGYMCGQLQQEWRIVAKKLRALHHMSVGRLQCAMFPGGICNNVRSPTARFYPQNHEFGYQTVHLQHLSVAAYMIDWALGHDDRVKVYDLDHDTFYSRVYSDDLHYTGVRKPWLVYFHSPRCHRCYEMYSDFYTTGLYFQSAVNLGKVNCIKHRSVCQGIHSYPTLLLYINRGFPQKPISAVPIALTDYKTIMHEVKRHLENYSEKLTKSVSDLYYKVVLGVDEHVHLTHDEL